MRPPPRDPVPAGPVGGSPVEPAGRRLARTAGSLPVVLILLIAAVCLVLGHLLLTEFMPSPAVGLLGFIFLVGALGYVLLSRNDQFSFAIIVYICSHFSFAENQGGLWNLLAAILILMHFALGLKRETLPGREMSIYVLLWVLVLANVLGWGLMSPVDVVERAKGAVAFLGFVLTFQLVSNLEITPARLRTFLLVTLAICVYQFLVALNQRYAVINLNTPLLGAYSRDAGFITYGSTNAQGTLRHSELFGEYGAMLWCMLLPVLSSSTIQKALQIRLWAVLLPMLLSLAFVALTSTRSAAFLVVVALLVFFVVNLRRSYAAIDRLSRQFQLGLFVLVVVTAFGAWIGVQSLTENLQEIDRGSLTTESIISGEALNRGGLFPAALERLGSQSWLIGFGWGTPRVNMWAWFGVDPARMEIGLSDYHNLYLALPMLFGWLGSAAFLGLVVLVWMRVSRATVSAKHLKIPVMTLALGLSLVWPLLMIDQYKISVLRSPGYFMIFWIWLGLSVAAARTLDLNRARVLQRLRARSATGDAGPPGPGSPDPAG